MYRLLILLANVWVNVWIVKGVPLIHDHDQSTVNWVILSSFTTNWWHPSIVLVRKLDYSYCELYQQWFCHHRHCS
jgi:hypothetical protein